MIHTFRTGGDRNLAYLFVDDASAQCAVIDPSYDPQSIVEFTRTRELRIVYAFNTHGHHDHINGNESFEAMTGVRPLRWGERDPQTGRMVADQATFPVGDSLIRVLHTPGHSPDSICLMTGKAVFTGDTLFVGKVGGTDLADGAAQEYASLHNVLLRLPGQTRVLPGHDVGTSIESTIQRERETNPFLLRADLASFVDLKANWVQYKEEHGIA